MINFPWILILLIAINFQIRYSSTQYICEPYFDGDSTNSEGILCGFAEQEKNALLPNKLHISEGDFKSPMKVQHLIHNFVCYLPQTCTIPSYMLISFSVAESVIKRQQSRHSFFMLYSYQELTYLAIQQQAIKERASVTNSRGFFFSGENYTFYGYPIKPELNVSVILMISADLLDLNPGQCVLSPGPKCILDFHSPENLLWLESIRAELVNELLPEIRSVLVIGSVVYNDEMMAQLRNQCSIISRFIPEIDISCRGLLEKDFSSQSQIDYRDFLARTAYRVFNTDYYIFLSRRVSPLHNGWLTFCIMSQVYNSLYQGFGVVLVQLSASVYLTVLQRSHFEIFSTFPNLNNDSFALHSMPDAIGDILLASLYYPFSSAINLNPLFLQTTESVELPLTKENLIEYSDRLLSLRRFLLSTLNRSVYRDAPLTLSDGDIGIHVYNPLYGSYCFEVGNCEAAEANIGTQTKSTVILSSIPKEVLCLFAHSSMRWKNYCPDAAEGNDTDSTGSSGDDTGARDSTVNNTDSSTPTRLSIPNDIIEGIDEVTNVLTIRDKRILPSAVHAYSGRARVAVITAIYGSYENTAKHHSRQSIPTDFYCFTDREDIEAPGWIIDTTPYHLLALDEELSRGFSSDNNALVRNQHPFNVAKFYKQQFFRIPLLADYEVVIWLDGTIAVTNHEMAREALETLQAKNETMLVFEHVRGGNLWQEAQHAEFMPRYNSTNWHGISQPIQNVKQQYNDYLAAGYRSEYWKQLQTGRGQQVRPEYGVWCTCFLAWNMQKSSSAVQFLSAWAAENRRYTTQDQVSFPFVAQALQIFPYSLPDDRVFGSFDINSWYVKLMHGL